MGMEIEMIVKKVHVSVTQNKYQNKQIIKIYINKYNGLYTMGPPYNHNHKYKRKL